MRNLILVTVDCLRADHLGCYGYPAATTPFLDRLSRTSWRFERAIATGTPTYYSFPAILASRYPLALGRNVVGLAPGETTLASSLRQAGYSTAAWIAGNPYLSARDGYHQGFDRAEDFLGKHREAQDASDPEPFRTSTTRPKKLLRALLGSGPYQELMFRYWCRWGRPRPEGMAAARQYPAADTVVDRAREWLRESAAEPFFLWLHLMDPHHPYYPPEAALAALGRPDLTADRAQVLNALWNREEVSRRRLERHREDVVALYDAGIRWVDLQIGELVGSLSATGRWQRTLFALTADHGEELLDRELLGHGGRFHYPVHLGPELTRVPLLIHGPATAGEVPGLFSLVDLAPTLLAMLGVEIPASFSGESRWRGDRFEPRAHAVTECVYNRRQPWVERGRDGARLVAIQNRGHKLVVNFATGGERLFDLDADPGETSPLAEDAARPARRELLEALREHLRRHRPDPRSRSYLGAQLAAIRRSLAAGEL